jgi:hypothetical protein
LVDGVPIAGVAQGGRQAIHHCLQGGEAAILADLLADDQASGAGDGDDYIDLVFFCWTKV